jgi:hypothetical protein
MSTPISKSGFRPFAVATSDWHLASSAYRNRAIEGDAYDAVARIIAYAIDHRLDVIAAGDLFDTPDPRPETVAFALEQVRRLRSVDLDFMYIQGQHELDRRRPWMSLAPTACHLNQTSIFGGPARGEISQVAIYGWDWVPEGQIAAAMAKIPEETTDLVVAHQVWLDVMGSRGEADADLNGIPRGATLLTGDFHEHGERNFIREDGSCLKIFSPGSVCMQSINEEPNKAFWVLGRDENNVIQGLSVPYPTRPFIDYTILDPQALETLLSVDLDRDLARAERKAEADGLAGHLRTPLVRVVIDPNLPDVFARIHAAAKGRCHLFPSLIGKPKTPNGHVSAPLVTASGTANPLELLSEIAAPGSTDHTLLKRLFESPDPRREIVELRSEFLAESV